MASLRVNLRSALDGKYLDYQPAEDFEGLSTVAYTGTDADGYPMHGKAFIRVSDSDTERAWAEELETQVIELAADQNRYRFGSPNDIHYYYRSDSDVFVNCNSEASGHLRNQQPSGRN